MTEDNNWSPEQLNYLLTHWLNQTDKEIADRIGRSSHSVRHKRCDLKLIRNIHRKKPGLNEDCVSTCLTKEEYYANWAADIRPLVDRLKKIQGTYKEKTLCPNCSQKPCSCRTAKSPIIISWT